MRCRDLLAPAGAVAALATLLLTACVSPGPDIVVEDVWSRATTASRTSHPSPEIAGEAAGEAPTIPGVAYFTVVNRGRKADRLLRVRTEICSDPEIHETRIQGDRARMVHVEEGIEVPPRGRLEFRPGGYHLMLIGLEQHLRAGERFEIALEFEASGTIVVAGEVRGV